MRYMKNGTTMNLLLKGKVFYVPCVKEPMLCSILVITVMKNI